MASSDPTELHATVALASQVGGHAGVQTSEDGSLLIKPALPLEQQFYQNLTTHSSFDALRPFIPKFFGTLKLEGKLDETPEGNVLQQVAGSNKDEYHGTAQSTQAKSIFCTYSQSLVLENLSAPFTWPNIMDIKLGTVLYDDSASPEKVERMKKTAYDTTSWETGVRLTGFQVYDTATEKAVNTPKSYGKSITKDQLPEGIAGFFPVHSAESPKGLPASLLLSILKGIREDIAVIKAAFSHIEMRMVGGSVLVIYEANIDKAKAGMEWLNEEVEEDSGEESESDDDDEKNKDKPHAPYIVKLIDFAHTKLVPGEGPDEGVLKGFDTTLKLLDGRIQEVQDLV